MKLPMTSSAHRALKAAFPRTIPVLTGYVFLGMAFGILLQSKGYGLPWALLMSLTVYAGALQFVGAGLLAGGFDPLQTALITLMLNARHIFYGFCMLEPFRSFRKSKLYMIFSLTDETFSLLCSVKPPAAESGVSGASGDPGGLPAGPPASLWLAISVLNQIYWVSGSLIGSSAGMALNFNPRGIDFVMTALFTVIFLEQWLKGRRSLGLLGIAAAALCLWFFGKSWFIIPSMLLILAVLAAFWFAGKRKRP